MLDLVSLWLPILCSAVAVFIVSSIIHMFLPYHNSDFKTVPSEPEVMEALRKFNIPPGDYAIPRPENMKEMKTDAYKDIANKGPVAFMTVLPNGMPNMGKSLVMWFIYSIIVSTLAAYVASRALGLDAYYLSVFRFVGVTAFVGYSLALMQNSIWYSRNWCSTLKSMFDGFVYALVTAGMFGWLWPTA